MKEAKQNTIGWLQQGLNRVRYGFPEGKSTRDRMDLLLGQEDLGLCEIKEMAHLMTETRNPRLKFLMSGKIYDSVVKLTDAKKEN